jgi:hypothetical protein
MAELDDLDGPRLKRITNDHAEVNMTLWKALADELELQTSRLESVVPGQQKKEAEALCRLGKISGCRWQPRKLAGAVWSPHVPSGPLIQQWITRAERRRALAAQLRGPNPDSGVVQEAFRVLAYVSVGEGAIKTTGDIKRP